MHSVERLHGNQTAFKKIFFANFELGGFILISVARKKKYFPIWPPKNLKKIHWKMQKITKNDILCSDFGHVQVHSYK